MIWKQITTHLSTNSKNSEFCILARPRDWIKLQTVADGSNRTTRLQLWTSSPSSRIDVATMMLTCTYCYRTVCNLLKNILLFQKWDIYRYIAHINTVPLRNSSTILFWAFLLCNWRRVLLPAIYSVFHPLRLGSKTFKRRQSTFAVITLCTKTIHLKSSKPLCE